MDDTQRPTHICFDSQGRVYVTELAWHEGDHSYSLGDIKKYRQARMSVFDKDGKVLARWGTPQIDARPAASPRRTASRSIRRTIST